MASSNDSGIDMDEMRKEAEGVTGESLCLLLEWVQQYVGER